MALMLLLVLRVLALAFSDDGEKAQTAQEGAWLLAERRKAAAIEGNLILFRSNYWCDGCVHARRGA